MSATRSRTTRRQAAPEPTDYTIKPTPAPEPTDEQRLNQARADSLAARLRAAADAIGSGGHTAALDDVSTRTHHIERALGLWP